MHLTTTAILGTGFKFLTGFSENHLKSYSENITVKISWDLIVTQLVK